MLYSFARVSAVVGMRRQDYFGQGSRGWLRLHEKGGKRHDVPGPSPGGRSPRRLRRGGRARGAAGDALPERGPGGAPADGAGAHRRRAGRTTVTGMGADGASAPMLLPRLGAECGVQRDRG